MRLLYAVLVLAAATMADEKAALKLLDSANDQFTARMFTEVVKSKPGESVVMSAFSVLPPLAQLGLASVGESREELLTNVGLPDYNTTIAVFSAFNKRIKSVKGVTLKIANRIYIPDDGSVLDDDFAKVSRDVFDSDVKNVNFAKNVETAAAINAWVEDQTNKKIKDLVSKDSLSSDTRAVLVNAIYFKGAWKNKFIPENTKERDFHVSKEKTIKVPTMHQKGTFKYFESAELNAKILELPYEGDETSLLVILPNEIDGLSALETKLREPNALSKATGDMYQYEVDVYLPKFKIETTTDLKDVLVKMGVKKLFSEKARLEKLLKGQTGLYVSDAVQKAFIEVNEEGAEAAAANAFIATYASAFIPRLNAVFDANHPFIFALREDTRTLFSGVYST